MKCSKKKLDAFVLSQIEEDGADAKPMTVEEAESYLDALTDLIWPNMPFGFTVEEFAESWNRQLKAGA